MKNYLKRAREAYKYTYNIDFTIKFILLQGLIPMVSTLFSSNSIRKKHTDLCKKRSTDILFTAPFGVFIAKTLNGWATITEQYEPRIKKIILNNHLAHKGEKKVFVNIGAHIGRRVVDITRNYDYSCVAFEPSKETFKYLQMNTMLSDITNKVSLHNFGLSNTSGRKEFFYIPDHDGHSHIVDSGSESNTTIETKVFDELDLGINTTDIALIIIDVEGHEYEVLQGMQQTLQKLHNVDIIIEIFDDSSHKNETFELMKSLGYVCHQISHADYLFSK